MIYLDYTASQSLHTPSWQMARPVHRVEVLKKCKKVLIYEFSHQKANFWISLQFLFNIWNWQLTWYLRDKIGTKFHNTASEILILYFGNTDPGSHWITDLLNWCKARLPTLCYCCFKQFVIIHLDLVANLATSNSLLANWLPSQWTWRCWVLHVNMTSLLDIECHSMVSTPHGRVFTYICILMTHNMIILFFIYLIFMSQIMFYFLHSTLVLSFYIDIVLTLPIYVAEFIHMNIPICLLFLSCLSTLGCCMW